MQLRRYVYLEVAHSFYQPVSSSDVCNHFVRVQRIVSIVRINDDDLRWLIPEYVHHQGGLIFITYSDRCVPKSERVLPLRKKIEFGIVRQDEDRVLCLCLIADSVHYVRVNTQAFRIDP